MLKFTELGSGKAGIKQRNSSYLFSLLPGALSEGQVTWDVETSAGLAVSQPWSQISTSKLISNIVPLSMFSCCTMLSLAVLWSILHKPT